MPTIEQIRKIVKEGNASIDKKVKIVKPPVITHAPKIPKVFNRD